MLIRGKLDRFLIIFRSTVIKVTERAIKLSSYDELLTFTLHHASFDTLPAGSFITTLQVDRLSILKIKEIFADAAF